MKFGVPAVRMDVTPDSRSPCAALAAYWIVCSAIDAAAMRGHSRCTCTSHKPGSTYAPPRSITWAPDPARADRAISAMRPFSIVTARPAATPDAAPPITLAFERTRVIGVRRSTVVERAATIAQPDPHEVPLAIMLRPVAEAGSLVGDLAVVQELHLPGLEVEVDGHVLSAHHGIERVERGNPGRVERSPGERLP